MTTDNVSILLAFAAGLLSFLSPCVLPLVPAYLGHLAGVTTAQQETADQGNYIIYASGAARLNKSGGMGTARLLALIHALAFVTGFSLVFVTFWASIGLLGQLLPGYIRYVRPLGGVVLIILGLNMAGLFRISFLYRSLGLNSLRSFNKGYGNQDKPARRTGLPASFFTGVIFAAGWTPCIGPVLGSIIGLASESTRAIEGIFLLIAYSLGLGVPFMLTALALGQANGLLRSLNQSLNGLRLVSIISGLFVAIVGVLILTNVFQTLPKYFNWLPL
ncbi:MAG: cytochrome c biogenesis protein CcdA [Chloroflexi bacterium]|nr:cytochrome c biogenesis protein CcdA [Chloroflexota bacterium]OJV92997.1 MAG: hypothetical protein BGO39_21005 [Chloroflexi bacterium 54-19]